MKPKTLKIMEALDGRTIFNDEHVRYLRNMQSGYLGECEFVGLMCSLNCPHILLRDLYFEPKFSGTIQIDFYFLRPLILKALVIPLLHASDLDVLIIIPVCGSTRKTPIAKKNSSAPIPLYNWRGRSRVLNHCFEN